MELYQLRCFLAIIEEGGFSRATSRLHITQPALSYQIKQLEQELGTLLFRRRPGGVSPTDAGRILYKHAQQVIESALKAQRAVEELAEGVVGDVRIGTVNSVGVYFLPHVLWTMRERYPRARLTILYRHSAEIMEALLSDRIDLAMLANPDPDRRLHQEVILEERVSLVCGRSHPFFGKKTVRPSELKGLQYIALSSESPTGALIHEHLAALGVSVEPVVSTQNVETVKKMVEVGMGVAFLPDMVTAADIACDGNGVPSSRLARIQAGPPLTRRIVLLTWKRFEMSRAVAAFVDEVYMYGSRWKGCLGTETP